jgi:hypothetical protein
MTSRRSSVSWVALVALALAGCGGGVDDAAGGAGGGPGGGGGEPNGEPTFYADVLPILQRSCLHCHSEGRIGGFSLATYEQARAQAGIIAAVTADGRMPPWHAVDTDVCQPQRPWLDDARLSDAEKATLRAWADTDAPEGDPADGPGDYQLPPTGLADPDLELEPANPSIVEGDVDQFTCVVYDPGLDADVFVEALNFEAGNAKVAHHALVFRVDRADAEALSGGDERFECFGAPGPDLIHAWAPGQTALELPPTVGMPLSPDQVIVVQMHYHPTGTSAEQDTSKIQLRFAAAEPEWEFTIALPGNASSAPQLLAGPNDGAEPEFTIPAGAEDHVERMVFEVPQLPADLPVLVVGTHMHYVGVDARFWIERAQPGRRRARGGVPRAHPRVGLQLAARLPVRRVDRRPAEALGRRSAAARVSLRQLAEEPVRRPGPGGPGPVRAPGRDARRGDARRDVPRRDRLPGSPLLTPRDEVALRRSFHGT